MKESDHDLSPQKRNGHCPTLQLGRDDKPNGEPMHSYATHSTAANGDIG